MAGKVAVIGAGTFGTTMTWMLLESGLDVSLWCYEQDVALEMARTGRNPLHMPELDIARAQVSSSMAEVLEGASSAIIACPSFAVASVAAQMAEHAPAGIPVMLLSKGLDRDGGYLYETVGRALGDVGRVAVLSGPNHAEELACAQFSGAVVASESTGTACFFQRLVSGSFFRLYTSGDPIGTSICGAAKNVVAIACGMARGLGLGSNTQSLLMTRGLAEISRLVIACGGDQLTCMGLAGVGDLDVTCHSVHSRNGMYGESFARTGISVAEYERQHTAVVEGAHAVDPLLLRAGERGVDMPLAQTVRELINGAYDLDRAVDMLTGRKLRPEFT
ncbi:MAG: NAD(P)H-dependent glycerol-3-phosphate dehydrogenase [Acidobacteriota bacterium]|nr:NAD(P)H-dependent glycerol-3-phosphate dehydrogenase [Acidobacteriota bacterium]